MHAITLSLRNVGESKTSRISYSTPSFPQNVQELIWKEIEKANARTSSLSIRKFRMITKELDHEDGDMTATQKVKRNVMMEKFSDLIEDMYK